MAAVPTHSVHRTTIYYKTDPSSLTKEYTTYYWDDKHIKARDCFVDADGYCSFQTVQPHPKELPSGAKCDFCSYGSPYEPHVYEFV